MKDLPFTRKNIVKALGSFALSCAIAPLAFADWSVQSGQILDPNGKPFVYRGVNLGILPPAATLPQVYADIAATGANAIRIPIDNLTTAQAQVHLNLCKQYKLVCVFTHVLSAGYVDSFQAPSSLYLIDVWSRHIEWLKANQDYAVIDIASAMAGNLATPDYYMSIHQTAIYLLRSWGLKNQIIISGGNWGQDWSFLMRDNADALLAFDPMKNTVLSVHMYEAYGDAQTVRSYLEHYTTRNLPIIVGEFGPIKRDRKNEYRNPYPTTQVAVDAIMDISQELGVGYLGWNWSGYKANDPNLYLPPDFAALNMVTNFDASQITPWGNLFINKDTGVKATAKLATHLQTSSSNSSFSSSSVGNQPPTVEITHSLTTATCGALAGHASAYASDPDGDALSYAWEIYQSNTMTTTYGTGQTIALTWPAQAETTITLTVDDGHGNKVTEVKRLGKNFNLDTCASSSSAPSSSPLSSAPKSSTSSIKTSSSSSRGFTTSSARSSSSSVRSSSSAAAQGNCSYVINSQWGNGFTAAIRIKNLGTQPINGWNVNWQYSDGSSITGSWNATFSGSNPYSAKNLNWNATIQPGQTVEFGFQGRKPNGPAQIPVVQGSVCR